MTRTISWCTGPSTLLSTNRNASFQEAQRFWARVFHQVGKHLQKRGPSCQSPRTCQEIERWTTWKPNLFDAWNECQVVFPSFHNRLSQSVTSEGPFLHPFSNDLCFTPVTLSHFNIATTQVTLSCLRNTEGDPYWKSGFFQNSYRTIHQKRVTSWDHGM